MAGIYAALGAGSTAVGAIGNLFGAFSTPKDTSGEWATYPKTSGAHITRFGVQQSNLGMVRCFTPPILKDRYNLDQMMRGVVFFTEAFNSIGHSIQTSEVRRYGTGNMIRMPVGNVNRNNVTITVMSDGEGLMYRLFYAWLNSIVKGDFKGSWYMEDSFGVAPYEVSYFEDYRTDMMLYELDPRMNTINEISLLDAYPIGISEKNMNWNGTNIVSFQVELCYRKVHIVDYDKDILKPKPFRRPTNMNVIGKLIKAMNLIQVVSAQSKLLRRR